MKPCLLKDVCNTLSGDHSSTVFENLESSRDLKILCTILCISVLYNTLT